MNPFDNITPPNMDVTCVTSYQYSTGTLATSTQTCSDPWNYYKGYGFDLVIILLIAFIIKKTLC